MLRRLKRIVSAPLITIMPLLAAGMTMLASCHDAKTGQPDRTTRQPDAASRSRQSQTPSPPKTGLKCRLTKEELLQLRSLLLSRRYEELEKRLAAIRDEDARDPARELETGVAFSTFKASDTAMQGPLADWTRAHPGSYAAHAARGLYHANQGWLSRGENSIPRTPPEQLRRMEREFEVARAELERSLSLNPKLMMVHSELISIAMAFGDREAMDAHLAAALRVNPLTLDARSAYLFALQPKWGGSVGAMEEFAHGAQLYAGRNPSLATLEGYVESFVRGPEAAGRGDYQQALAHHDEALRHGETTLFLLPRAQALNALGRYRESIADSTRVLEIRPHNLMAMRYRAEALYATGQVPRALEDVATGLSFDPADDGLLTYRAWINEQAKRYDESLADYERALTARANKSSLWAGKGRLLIEHLGRLKEGEDACRKALALDDQDGTAWFCQGLALSGRGSPDAKRSFERSLALEKGTSPYVDLAYRYLQGRGMPLDVSEAVRLFAIAAERGDRIAQANLGYLYLSGQGVPKDYEKGRRWVRAAAEAGEPSAMGSLGLMYAQAIGVPRDYEKAAHWFREAIRGGHVPARVNLGVMFWYGHGRPKDLVMAYRWIKSAELMGDADAKRRVPELLATMTPEQIKQGDHLVQQDSPP